MTVLPDLPSFAASQEKIEASLQERQLEIREVPPETSGGNPFLPAMDTMNRISFHLLGRELGRDKDVIRKRAVKLGCLIEKRWIVDTRGHRCLQNVTDDIGAEALRRWFAR